MIKNIWGRYELDSRLPQLEIGPLHIGGIRTALYNWIFAKKMGGDFILRIEDTDSKREVDGSIDYLMESLEWLGIKPTEGYGIGGDFGPYKQSNRKEIYKMYIGQLIESGNAYYAFDSREELADMKNNLVASGVKNTGYSGVSRERMKNSLVLSKDDVDARLESGESYVVRFNMPRNKTVQFTDKVRGVVTFNTQNLDDKVIWKSSDELPTYHLANIVDDHLMNITHVIRGEEWVSSTPLHILLYDAFEWDKPEFIHLPLILAPNGKKLGKRDGDKYGIPVFPLSNDYIDADKNPQSITGFRESGFEPDALVNYLSLLGWNPGDNTEIMSVDYMVNNFSLERINKSGAKFDIKKLKNFNGHYLREMDNLEILYRMTNKANFSYLNDLSLDKLEVLSRSAVERIEKKSDLSTSMSYLWEGVDLSGDFKIKNADEFTRVMDIFCSSDIISTFEDKEWTPSHITEALEFVCNSMDIKVGKVRPMLRVAISGGVPGPSLSDLMYIIGKEDTVYRINNLIEHLSKLA